MDQTTSNTVLFEMMNFYKRRAEHAEATNDRLMKKMKQECEDHNNEMARIQHQLHQQIQLNSHLQAANVRGARTILRKHNAGLRLAHCLDDLVGAIELVEETRLGGEDALGCMYINMHKDRIKGRADSAIQLLVHNELDDNMVDHFENEVADTLLAQEVIDLTGESTEEEELSEDEE